MKKVLLVLLVAVSIMSCSKEDRVTEICGKVETFAQTCSDGGCTWYVFLTGHEGANKVDFDTFEYASRNRGKVICIEPLPW